MVTILLPVYNSEKYLGELLNSIAAQTYEDWHLIIQDDNSTDGTLNIVQTFKDRYPDKCTVYVNSKNSGSARNNFFSLISKAEGDYIMTCDHDDVWHREKISFSLLVMKNLEDEFGEGVPILTHTKLIVTDDKLNVINSSYHKMEKIDPFMTKLNYILMQNCVVGCTMMINKPLLDIYRQPKNAIMHDWYFAILASLFGKIYYIDSAAIYYRQHGDNQIGVNDISNFDFLKMKAFDRDAIKKSMDNIYSQGEEILSLYNDKLSKKQKKILKAFIKLKNGNKITKLYIVFRYRFFKSSIFRIIGQLLNL